MTTGRVRMHYDGIEQSRRASRRMVTVDPPYPEARYKFPPDSEAPTFRTDGTYHEYSRWVIVRGKEVLEWFEEREGFEVDR